MNRLLVTAAVCTVLLGGCGSEDEATHEQAAQPAVEATPPPMEAAQPTTEVPAAPTAEPETAPAMPVDEMATEAAGAVEEAAAATEEMAQDAAASAEEVMSEVAEAAPMAADRGMEVYQGTCFACHGPGIAGAPKLGDKAAWAPRIAQGMEILVSHAINGFQGASGVMPPKGGRTDLSDEDISLAVTYMVEQSQ